MPMKNYLIVSILVSSLVGGEIRTLAADPEISNLRWIAEKVTGSHWGYVSLKEGSIEIKNDRLVSGDFIVDMKTIKVMDIKDSPWGKKLEAHLHSKDFFDTENHPEAHFSIHSVKMKNNDLLISGDLTIKDITHTLDFNCEVTHAKNSSSAKGQMKIDRTLYDIIYRSFKYFPDIGDRMIDDIFTIDFEIDAK